MYATATTFLHLLHLDDPTPYVSFENKKFFKVVATALVH